MDYEYQIYCQCATLSSGGGYSQPVQLSDEEVLAKAWHNPGCPVADSGQGVVSQGQSEDSHVAVYDIAVGE